MNCLKLAGDIALLSIHIGWLALKGTICHNTQINKRDVICQSRFMGGHTKLSQLVEHDRFLNL